MRCLSLLIALFFTLSHAQTPLPPGGERLISSDIIIATEAAFSGGWVDGEPIARAELVELEDAPDLALEVTVERPTSEFWIGTLYLPINAPVQKGDVLLVRMFFRSIENREETGNGFATIFIQGPEPEYKKYLLREVNFGADWREILLMCTVTDDLPAGQLRLAIGSGGGAKEQVWQVGSIELLNYGPDAQLDDLPITRSTYGGREPDAPWRAEAAARIEKHRKGDFTVKLVDAAGKPLAGVPVALIQQQHDYQFGTAVSVQQLMAKGKDPDTHRYREVLLELFNSGGPENGLKWPTWAGDWSDYWNQKETLAAIVWLKEHGFYVRGHVMVWPSRQHLPKVMQAMLPKDAPADPAAKKMVIDHIKDLGQTVAYIDEWDVVNEPYNNHDLMDAFGDEIMVDWFKHARANFTTQSLYLNDFGILSSQGRDLKHQQHYANLLRYLIDSGASINGMGMQGHFGEIPTAIPRVYEILDEFHGKFPELAIRITEFDVRTKDEQMQADYTRDFLTIAFSHPGTVGVQVWGFWAGRHWIPEAAMFASDWREKPNGTVWRELIKETWSTQAEGETNAAGEFTFRGFYGSYDLLAPELLGQDGQTLEFPKNGASERVVTVE